MLLVPTEPVDLTNCDREPIHIPGSIQPHGCLIACDANLTHIRRHSANAVALLRLPEGTALNDQKFDAVFGEFVTHEIRNAAARCNDPARPAVISALSLGEGQPCVDVSVHQFKGTVIVEFEINETPHGDTPLELARTLIGRLGQIQESSTLLNSCTRLLRGLLNYDRVMVYRFAHDGSGEVVSEAKRAELESFLGQHFPATDIPRQARALYLANTIRIVSSADAERIPIVPEHGPMNDPLDLSFAHLRSVSPIHCEYLRNMGVSASMSISIILDGALWGLIACHHYAPRSLTMTQRIAAEMFGQYFAMNLQALNNRRLLDLATQARSVLDSMVQRMSHHLDVVNLLQDNIRTFASLLPCDGIGLWINGQWTATGSAPPENDIPALTRFINSVAGGRVWATHALSDSFRQAMNYHAAVSGVLAIPLSQIPRDYLLFFRKEVAQTINWAGDPEKVYSVGPQGERLTPRKSFAIWKETVERQAAPWNESDRNMAEAARGALVEIVLRHSEVLADERAKYDLRQKMLNEELNHRVKNILALIKSLVSHPVDDTRSLEVYVASLKSRIQALSYAHDQVIRGSGGGQLSDLLNAELSPYRNANAAIVLEGPPLVLDARAFSVMALVLHELATNAAKYGALSVRQGRLTASWRQTDDGSCELLWREAGGPPVSPPSRKGFGSVLLDRSIPFDLGGVASIDYAASGLKARFVIPGRYVSQADAASVGVADAAPVANGAAVSPKGLNILLVEDQLIIALDAEMMLMDMGAAGVEMVSSVDEALTLLKRSRPDVAVLDINLGTDNSWPVAEALQRQGIPFVLASGYGDLSVIPGAWSAAPLIRKPYSSEGLAEALVRVLKSH